MLGKYKTASLIIVTILFCSAAVWAAPSYINKLGLSRDGSFTVLTIQGSDQLRYAHQSVEAKEGKPFRIVIDCLASRHNLPQRQYLDLPPSIIKSIRTSQYSVTPEEVVRIVMDLNEESVYRVETDNNMIKVLVSDQKTASFTAWNSKTVKSQPTSSPAPVVSAEKPAKKAAEVKKEREVVIADKPKPSTAVKSPADKPKPSTARKPSVVKQQAKPSKPVTVAAPYAAKLPPLDENAKFGPVLATTAKPEKSQPVSIEKAEPSAVGSQQPVKSKPAAKIDLAQNTKEKAEFFASTETDKPVVPEPGMATENLAPEHKNVDEKVPAKTDKPKSPVEDKKETQPSASKPAPTVPSPVKEDKEVVVASTDQPEQKPATPDHEQVEKIRTSKYRRESAKNTEFKASQVVQFPQRMVIKYKRPSQRDPFESLITADKKRKANYDLTRIPNVEALNLVGILEPWDGKGAALMEDRDGIGYILRPGDRVQNGYVAQIDDFAIYFQINEYGWGRTVVKHMDKD